MYCHSCLPHRSCCFVAYGDYSHFYACIKCSDFSYFLSWKAPCKTWCLLLVIIFLRCQRGLRFCMSYYRWTVKFYQLFMFFFWSSGWYTDDLLTLQRFINVSRVQPAPFLALFLFFLVLFLFKVKINLFTETALSFSALIFIKYLLVTSKFNHGNVNVN